MTTILKTNKINYAVLGGFATVLAFSAKGLMGFVIIGFCVLAYLLYSREWKRIFNFKTLLFFASCVVFLSAPLNKRFVVNVYFSP